MVDITLKPKKSEDKIPLEAESISCDVFAGKTIDEIKKLPIFKGNRKKSLGDFFDVSGSKEDDPKNIRIIIDGDVSHVKNIGRNMKAGEILIKGNAGMHTAEYLNGGTVVVEGDVGDFSANEVKKGKVHVKGNAGAYFASALRGSWRGVKGGEIICEGNVGIESGTFLAGKNTRLRIKGNASSMLGLHLAGGVIILDGNALERLGGQMARGKIIVNGKLSEILPSFSYEGEVDEIVLSDEEKIKGKYLRFKGDFAEISPKS
ncbi:MAG: formylmethanofuran dehydrogenase subunit C, partial [Candidatus Helarchaeota archaeon]